MKLSTWMASGALLAATALPVGAANAGNPGPMSVTQSAPASTTTYCQFNSGPRAGVTVKLRGIPFAIGVACGDGNGSYGVSVPPPAK
ncbi:MAG TPA: hypothetical protein VII73_13405 [Caulobacteraceae bacterium]